MRKRTKRREDAAEVNMTPMLDIVFILLIFFIVTATFLNEEGIDMQPPPDEAPPCPDCPAPIVVQVTEDNRIYVNGVITDVDRVISAVNRFRAENAGAAVLIEANNEARHGIIVRIWDDMQANAVPVSLRRAEEDAATR